MNWVMLMQFGEWRCVGFRGESAFEFQYLMSALARLGVEVHFFFTPKCGVRESSQPDFPPLVGGRSGDVMRLKFLLHSNVLIINMISSAYLRVDHLDRSRHTG